MAQRLWFRSFPGLLLLTIAGSLTVGGAGVPGAPVPVEQEAPWRIASFSEDAGVLRRMVFDVAFETNHTAWFAVSDGLYRYDGYRWSRFTVSNSLPSSFVRTVSVTRDGSLWVGTDRGAGVFDGTRFDRRGTEGRLAGPSVRRIVETSDGSLWFCCDRWPDATLPGGLTRWKAGEFQTFGMADGLPTDHLLAFFEQSNGRLMALTPMGPALWQEGRWSPMPDTGYPPDEHTWAMHEAPDGSVFAQAFNDIYRLAGGQWRACREGSFPGSSPLCVTRDGSVVRCLVDSRGRGLFARWDGNAFVQASSTLPDQGSELQAVKQAPDGSIWAVGRGTILRWDYLPGAWTWHPDLPPPAFEDRQHRMWFADQQRTAVIQGGEVRQIPGIHQPIFEDGQGVVWGAGENGVVRWVDGQWEAVPESVTGMATLHGGTRDNEGVAWLRGMNRDRAQSLAALTPGGWRVFGPAALGERSIMSITADPERGVWVVLNEDRTSVYEIVRVTADGLSPVEILGAKPQTHLPRLCGSRTHLYLQGYNGLWESPFGERLQFTRVAAGSGGGYVDSESIGDVTAFLAQEGMDGNAAILLVRDHEWSRWPVEYGEGMWLANSGWLMVANGPEFVLWQVRQWNTPAYVSLPTETTIRSIVRCADGGFWLGIREGVVRLQPGATLPDTLLDGPRTCHRGDPLLLRAHGVAPFVPRARTKRFSFSWRLDSAPWSGYGDWPANGIPLEGVSPGNHTLEARARDGLGNEDPTPASLAFTILPTPIQEQPWFRPALAGMIGILAALSFALYRTTQRLRRYSVGLEEIVLARTEELRQDIARRQQAEEEKEKLQAQLNQAQKMESVGRLAGGVAHDFNNMLQAILGNAALALEQVPPSSPLHRDLLEIQQAAQRSADLTRQLLAFARKQTLDPKVLNLNDTLARMLQMLRRLIGEDIELRWHPGPDLWQVKMDPSQLDQILANLCVNARDAISGTGQVTIETSNLTLDDTYARSHPECVPGDYVLLAVSDTGKGMDADTRSHLFEPFFTTKKPGQGTGLGLATVFGIVKQHLGLISVYSEPGRGTTFKIYLPRVQAPPSQEDPLPQRDVLRGTETVLLVEDESQILHLAQRILERQGYTVLAARTPSAALDLAKTHRGPIHVLLTDVVMPEMNGRELHQRLTTIHPKLRCLFMSGYTANVIAHHGVLDEGVQFLQKPFTVESIALRIRETLERPAPG